MNDSSNISSQQPIISPISQGVANLKELQPITKLGQITRKIVDLTSFKSTVTARNESIRGKVREITSCVEAVLKQLPEDLRDKKALRQKLDEDPDYQVVSDGKTILSHEDLEEFYQEVDTLFCKIHPRIKDGAFHIKDAEREAAKMPKLVQEYLSPELKVLRKEKQSLPKDSTDPEQLRANEEHKTSRKAAKGRLAIDTGHGIKRNKGATGTLLIKDINGKFVGVHKVSEKDVPLLTRLKNFLKSIFGGQLTYLSKKNLAQPLSERAAYLMSSGLGFHITPPSSKADMKDIVGVFQVFLTREKKDQGIAADVKQAKLQIDEHAKEKEGSIQSSVTYPKGKGPHDYVEAKDMLPQLDAKSSFTDAEKIKFQQFAIYDFIIGNLDRHEENWFVTVSTDNELTSIKAIDNANAFPKKQPRKGSMAAKNQYKWQTLNLAKQTFTKDTQKFVRDNLNPEKVKVLIDELKAELPEFLDPDMERLLVKRARVAYEIVLKGNQTPEILAKCSTEEEMEEFRLSFQPTEGKPT